MSYRAGISQATVSVDPKDIDRYAKQQRKKPVLVDEDRYHAVSSSQHDDERNHQLFLGAAESFFDPPGRLRAMRSGASTDAWNQKRNFSGIKNIQRRGDKILWPLFFDAPVGWLQLHAKMQGATAISGRLRICLDGHTLAVAEPRYTDTRYAFTIEVYGVGPGRHDLTLELDGGKCGVLNYFRVECSGNVSVVRERWRPLAVHGSLHSTAIKQPVAWVAQLRAVGELSCFSPMSTPFGYYGPVMKPAGASGMNFSFWSYGRGKPKPRAERLSQIVAIGSEKASFGWFDHEGHGVKIRAWNPWATNVSGTYVLALKHHLVKQIPKADGGGFVYAFTSWFWDEDHEDEPDDDAAVARQPSTLEDLDLDPDGDLVEATMHDPEEEEALWETGDIADASEQSDQQEPGRWKLFGVGLKWRSKKLASLPLNTFVEVRGPAERQRSNYVSRPVQYRGFVCDPEGAWGAVDRLQPHKGQKPPPTTNKRWFAATAEDRDSHDFVLSCGGLEQAPHPKGAIAADDSTEYLPDMPAYMKRIAQIDEPVPFPRVDPAHGESVQDIGVELTGALGVTTVKLTVYFGPEDVGCRTHGWASKHVVEDVPVGGVATVHVPGLEAGHTCRVRAVYPELQVFSMWPVEIPAPAPGPVTAPAAEPTP